MFASHSWPRFGNARIQEVMRTQRDAYANLNNDVLHLANQGVTINEIHNVYKLPKSLQQQWAAHSYHGSEEHNSRAVINRYLGYWDANPATLIPLSPRDSAPLYVEMMGGANKIMAKGKELYDQGKYREAMEILNKLVYAEPNNQAAKDLLADVFEQIGYQKESPSVRNSFLAAAYELRSGMPGGVPPKTYRAGHDPRHVDRPLARLPRHPSGQQEGRRHEVRHQPGHARQRREVRGGDEQLDAHQHQGRAGEEPGPDHYDQSLRSRDGDGRQGHVRRADRQRQGEVRWRSQALRPAQGHPGPVHPGLRNDAGHQAGEAGHAAGQGPVRAGRAGKYGWGLMRNQHSTLGEDAEG